MLAIQFAGQHCANLGDVQNRCIAQFASTHPIASAASLFPVLSQAFRRSQVFSTASASKTRVFSFDPITRVAKPPRCHNNDATRGRVDGLRGSVALRSGHGHLLQLVLQVSRRGEGGGVRLPVKKTGKPGSVFPHL